MRNSKDAMEEILAHLKLLSNNVLLSESIHEELSLFRIDTNEKIQDLKESIKEITQDFKIQHKDFDSLEREILELKNEIEPIIEIKDHVQKQILRYSAFAFGALLMALIGINEMGI